MKSNEVQGFVAMDADHAGDLYTQLEKMADYLGQHLEEQIADGTTTGPKATKVLIRLGQLMGKLERMQVTAEELEQIQNILEE